MKVSLVTIRVPAKPMYDEVTSRWQNTYLKFMPEIEHELIVVDSDMPESRQSPIDRFISKRFVYDGGGWDCGIWQFVGKKVETDLLVCCNTSTYFERSGWLERLVDAASKHGKGLYGPMGSLNYYPHIRTPCMVFQPDVITGFPWLVKSRDQTYAFECLAGRENFTLWCVDRGFVVKQVTWDGEQSIEDWRKPDNVFWKGDQSNVVVKDRHANRYDTGTEESRLQLNREANGKTT